MYIKKTAQRSRQYTRDSILPSDESRLPCLRYQTLITRRFWSNYVPFFKNRCLFFSLPPYVGQSALLSTDWLLLSSCAQTNVNVVVSQRDYLLDQLFLLLTRHTHTHAHTHALRLAYHTNRLSKIGRRTNLAWEMDRSSWSSERARTFDLLDQIFSYCCNDRSTIPLHFHFKLFEVFIKAFTRREWKKKLGSFFKPSKC